MSVTLLLLLIGRIVLGVRIESPGILALAVSCSSLCFVGLMMLISTLGRTEQAVAGAGWAAMMPFAMLGGGMVPLFVMPTWMVSLSHISPVKWTISSLEGAIWRGYTLTDMALPCTILLAIGAGSFFFGVTVLARREL